MRIFGFRKELHLQKEKEDSADFKKPVQEDSPQEGIKDRETAVAPSLTAMENTSQTSAQQLTDPEETILCHPDKKKKIFFPGRIAGFIRKFPEKIRNILQKILYFLRNIQTFWKKGTRTCRKWYRFFNDEKNKKAFSNIWKQLEHLVVSVLPKRLKLWLKYSTGSPDTTGQVLGILAIFPVGYRNHWNIIPDFTAEEFYKGTGHTCAKNSTELLWEIICKWKQEVKISNEDRIRWMNKINQLISLRVDGIMTANRRKYYHECAAFISAYGEVKESHGIIGEKNTFMAEYRKRYPRRSAFIQELVKFGYVK